MAAITGEFRVYPLPDVTEYHNLVHIDPESADEQAPEYRGYSVASDAYLSELQAQVDGLTRGSKIRATIRDVDTPGPAVFDGEIEHLGDESVYLDYCIIPSLPDPLQPMAAGLTETEFPETGVFDERIQADGPGVYVEVYPMFGPHADLWFEILTGTSPLEDQFASLPCITEPAQDVLVQVPQYGRAFTIYYFSAESYEEMTEYRSLVETPRGSTHELNDIFASEMAGEL